jgi:hypothetical protein
MAVLSLLFMIPSLRGIGSLASIAAPTIGQSELKGLSLGVGCSQSQYLL